MSYNRILVCGSRTWNDEAIVHTILEGFYQDGMTIIDGMAKGADTFGFNWAQFHEDFVKSERYPADWNTYGKRAGYLRNVQMLEEGKPDLGFGILKMNDIPIFETQINAYYKDPEDVIRAFAEHLAK